MKRILWMLLLLAVLLPIGWAQTTTTSKASNELLEGTKYVGLDGLPYVPMTDDQVTAWLKTVTPDVLFSSIRKLDLIEHTQPIVTVPEAVVGVLKNDSIFLGWTDPGTLNIDVAGQLSYSLKLDPKEFPGQIKHDNPLKIILGLVVGSAVSSFGSYALTQLDTGKTLGIWNPVISFGVGGLAGGLTYVLIP